MAEILNQNEIDDLLNSNLFDEGDGGGGDSGGSSDEQEYTSKSKIYKFAKESSPRFNFPYKSPLIKQGRFVFNPAPDEMPTDDAIVVVQSLAFYNQHNARKREYN